MEPKKDSIHIITWIDSASSHDWEYEDTISIEPMKITTVGVIVQDKKDYIVVSSSFGGNGCYNSPMAIPKAVIEKIEDLDI